MLAFCHRIENSLDKRKGHGRVKKVAHGIDKNHPGNSPRFRKIDHVVMQCEIETVAVTVISHRLQSLRQSFRVTILAARADFCATRHWIPRRFCPLDV
jgi:hypothetical protein